MTSVVLSFLPRPLNATSSVLLKRHSRFLVHLMQIGTMWRATANKIAESLYVQDTKKLQDGIGEYLKKVSAFMMPEQRCAELTSSEVSSAPTGAKRRLIMGLFLGLLL